MISNKKMSRVLTTAALCSAAAIGMAVTPASALNIVLAPDASFTNSPNGAAALLGFQKAANYWNKTITSNATLLFDVHFDDLGANTLGGTYSNTVDTSVASVYHQLQTTGNSTLDQIAVANLRPLSAAGGVAYRTPGTDPATGLLSVYNASSHIDNNDTYNNRVLNANTSVDKGLGLSVNYNNSLFNTYNQLYGTNFDTHADADITFSSTFDFDYDPSNGINTGAYDFVGVAIHEMGHALGFVSGTDDYEYNVEEYAGANALTAAEQDQYSWLSTLDLFRYGATTPGSLQLDPNRDAFFSVDGQTPFNFVSQAGQASPSFFSTGANFGDGGQASHWIDSPVIFLPNGCDVSARPVGIMDPTADACQVATVTSNDLAAFDAMGWNINTDIYNNRGYTFTSAQAFNLAGLASILPEPSSWAMMIGGFGLVGASMRRRRRVTVSYA